MTHTILILGAGSGGIAAAYNLRKRLARTLKSDSFKIILFEKDQKNVFAPSLLWLMVGKRKAEQIYRKTSDLAKQGIELVLGEIENINPENKSVTVNGQLYQGQFMIVSLGIEQTIENNLNDYGANFYTLEGATKFYKHLSTFKGGKIAVLVPSLPFKCPAAPYEAAMLIAGYIKKQGLTSRTEISLYTPEPGPMGVAGKELSAEVKKMIEHKGIRIYTEFQLLSATENSLNFSNGESANYDLLCFTPKHQCPTVIKKTNLVGPSGWIEPHRNTLETAFPGIYAIGDITFIPLEIGRPLPKAGVFAHAQAKVVAFNITQKILGNSETQIFNGEGQCFLEIADGKAAYAAGNFYASPKPNIKIKKPSYLWHLLKVTFEKYWLIKHF